MKDIFLNAARVSSIILTTANINESVERPNSALRHVKTDFRSIVGEGRLITSIYLSTCMDPNNQGGCF